MFTIFLDIEINESRLDFRCNVNIDQDFIRGKCFDQYQKQYNKLGIPLYAFIIVNFSAIFIVTFIYSKCVNKTVDGLENGKRDEEGESRNERGRRRLFHAYLVQLAAQFTLAIMFIIFVETQLLYPKKFPVDFTCLIEEKGNDSDHLFKNHTCITYGATYKNSWINAVTVVNGIFALFALVEMVLILSRAKRRKRFMDNRYFYSDHLTLNSDKRKRAIRKMKHDCLNGTEQLHDLNHLFRCKPGEGPQGRNLKIDQIYVDMAIQEGRAPNYPKPEDIFDKEHTNVLVVGRPGIGKTFLSTKILRMWAAGEAFNGGRGGKRKIDVVFLLRFKFLNQNTELTLRELLASGETVERFYEAVWEFVIKNPNKVLLIFDGVDEFSAKQKIAKDDSRYTDDLEQKMPVSALFRKLASGKLLRGANLMTTTRPTAVTFVENVDFDRKVEIRGFTFEKMENYVENFAQGVDQAKDKIWGHIKSNINLFSLCYIPVNCFLVCHCLQEIIKSNNTAHALPSRITDIYKMVVKIVFFNHNRERCSQTNLNDYMYLPFHKLPIDHKVIFKRLGEIAFEGIKQGGRLVFESSEVSGMEDCGLLHRLPDAKSRSTLSDPPKAQFCFTYLTVQEFFAAKHVVETMTKKKINAFVRKHINDGEWEVVLQFVAGLLEPDPQQRSSSCDIFINLLPTATEETDELMYDNGLLEKHTLTRWPVFEDQQLAVNLCKCLYEIRDEKQQAVLQEKLKEIGFNAVHFSECSLAPVDFAAVSYFLQNASRVVSMNLFGNFKMTDLGAKEVQKLIENSKCQLESLSLACNKISDEGAEYLSAALKDPNCKLNQLNLWGNNITNVGAEHLASALKHRNCKLKYLNVEFNLITDEAALAEASKHSNCEVIFDLYED